MSARRITRQAFMFLQSTIHLIMCGIRVKISFASQTRPEMINFTKVRVIRVTMVDHWRRHVVHRFHSRYRTSGRPIAGEYWGGRYITVAVVATLGDVVPSEIPERKWEMIIRRVVVVWVPAKHVRFDVEVDLVFGTHGGVMSSFKNFQSCGTTLRVYRQIQFKLNVGT
jgi:hypothetical protein